MLCLAANHNKLAQISYSRVTIFSSSIPLHSMFVFTLFYSHQVRYCQDIGITSDAASQLFIYYGLASCVGRLVTGRLCDFEKVNTFYVYQAAELVVGTGTLLVTLATSYLHMIIFIVIYGLCDGIFITSLNVLLLTTVSPERTPAAIGWEMQISSLFLASGPPIAGMSYYPKGLANGIFFWKVLIAPKVLHN